MEGSKIVFTFLLLSVGQILGFLICPDTYDGKEVYAPSYTSCEEYYHCVNGVPFTMTCPDGLYWDQSNEICNWPDQVNPPCPYADCSDIPNWTDFMNNTCTDYYRLNLCRQSGVDFNYPENNCCACGKGPTPACILYDDENLDGREGYKEMDDGDQIGRFEKRTGFDVESLFVKKGCQLDAYTETKFKGDHKTYKAEKKDTTFMELRPEFHDNIESAKCTCVAQ